MSDPKDRPPEPTEGSTVRFSVQHSVQLKWEGSRRIYTFVAIRCNDHWYTSRIDDEIEFDGDHRIRWGVPPLSDWTEIVEAAHGPIEVASGWAAVGVGKGNHTHEV
ncbi:hypothetical protein OG203_16485 [Nocardia sp. NBC_01499]|uniref:hypothetical protein n=1 Tax=Nocardia sp. NBC_01499 TaxID=2903597 RepID=UPI00386FAEF1